MGEAAIMKAENATPKSAHSENHEEDSRWLDLAHGAESASLVAAGARNGQGLSLTSFLTVPDSTRSASTAVSDMQIQPASSSSPVVPDISPAIAPSLPDASAPSAIPTSELDFSQDIYGTPEGVQQIEQQLLSTDLNNITLTTPAQDASTHTQPDFYLNAEGQLVKNPLAQPSPNGSIKIEVEGNNSAKQAEQYANKLQKETIQYLVNSFRQDHPGEKIPEMWQAVLDSNPDSSFANDGDSQNNNTVTAPELQAYNSGQAAPPDLPPPDDKNPQTIPQGQPGEGAPSTGPSEGSGRSSRGGSPDGHFSNPGTQSNIPNQVTGNGGAPTGNLQISSGTMAHYDGNQADMSDTQRAIVAEANKDLGSAMWGGWSGADAVEGCAASVSQILDNSGAANLHNAQDDNCNGMQADLLAQGWTITDKPQPGDVWIGRGGASSGHTGIVGENNTLMDNHSNNGLFSRDPGSFTGEWSNSVFLKPPDKTAPPTNNTPEVNKT